MNKTEVTENKKFDFKSLKRIIGYAFQYPKVFYGSIAISIVLALLQISRPWVSKIMINDYIIESQSEKMLLQLMMYVIAIVLVEVVLNYFFVIYLNWIGQKVVLDLRKNVYKKIIYFSNSYFDKSPIGILVTRVVNDIQTIVQVFSDGLLIVFGDVLRLIFVIVAMFVMNWRFALLVIIMLPFVFLTTKWFQRSIKVAFQNERTQIAKLNTFMQERLSGMHIVQQFNQERREYLKFVKENKILFKAHKNTIFYFAIFFPMVELYSAFALGLILYFGGVFALDSGKTMIGDMIAFIMFIQMLFRPLRQMADKFNQMQRGLIGAKRVFDLMDRDEAPKDVGTSILKEVNGHIEFKNVHFEYVEDTPVLKGVDIDFEAGKMTAIVGSTGAGKSTIIHLINRFYDIQKGDISIDGIKIKNYQLASLREQIGVIQQDVFIFSDSFLENISLGEDISKEYIEDAAKQIGIDQFINELPDGIDTMLYERGSNLSVGQRQLVSFLRIYVRNPKILILDEATASIDSNTELMLQKAFERITKGRTSIVIAHRLATIKNADKIVVMEQGKVEESGSHSELMSKEGGVYKNLVEVQFSSQDKM